jgi:hypothetical protein
MTSSERRAEKQRIPPSIAATGKASRDGTAGRSVALAVVMSPGRRADLRGATDLPAGHHGNRRNALRFSALQRLPERRQQNCHNHTLSFA